MPVMRKVPVSKPGWRVQTITRSGASHYLAVIAYASQDVRWTERVLFTRRASSPLAYVTISDADYPADRTRRVAIHSQRDMSGFIRSYIEAGRW